MFRTVNQGNCMASLPSGRTLLKALKDSATRLPPSIGVCVGEPVEAVLRPLGNTLGSIRHDDVRFLTEWRNRFVTSFLTEFIATNERTHSWVANTIGQDDGRILFMVDDVRSSATVGYMGLAKINWDAGAGEADSIVRGGSAAPGFMKRTMVGMLDWAVRTLGLATITVRVRSDNPAIGFYRSLGGVETHRIPLRRTVETDSVVWVEDATLPSQHAPSLVYMLLRNT